MEKNTANNAEQEFQQKHGRITEETHKPITVEIEQKAGTTTIECPHCGKALRHGAKYCTKLRGPA
jgi:predicted RNA-binding Zn-ribbon protein involved in translation (DUF1610 family)